SIRSAAWQRQSAFSPDRWIWTRNSKAENTATNQVREPLPLFGVQHRMDFLKGAGECLAQPRCALNAALACAGGLGRVERVSGDRVSKLGKRSPVIHLGLSPLGLDLIEDPDQGRDLFFVKVELMREEPQRASHAEG